MVSTQGARAIRRTFEQEVADRILEILADAGSDFQSRVVYVNLMEEGKIGVELGSVYPSETPHLLC